MVRVGELSASTTQRFPIGDTGLTVSVLVPNSIASVLYRKKNRQRTWTEIERVLSRYYVVMAADLQRLVTEEYQRERRRPKVSTGRLDEATLDERNRRIDKGGFGIGLPTYLNRSQAKYWRQIEYGTSVHRGRYLYGMFGATLTGSYSKRGNAQFGPAWSYVGRATGGGFTPKAELPEAFRSRHFSGPRKVNGGYKNQEKGGYSRGTRLIIGKSIDAQRGYKKAYERFRASGRAFQLFRQVVIDELGLPSDQVGRSYESIINGVF